MRVSAFSSWFPFSAIKQITSQSFSPFEWASSEAALFMPNEIDRHLVILEMAVVTSGATRRDKRDNSAKIFVMRAG